MCIGQIRLRSGEHAVHHGSRLKILPGSLVGRIWPRERVLLGMRASTWLREELKQNAASVLFCFQLNTRKEGDGSATDVGVGDCAALSRAWGLFAGKHQEVWISMVGQSVGGMDAEEFLPKRMRVLGLLAKSVPSGLHSNLAHLDLRRAMLGDEGARTLASMISDCKALTFLNLRANNFSDEGVSALSQHGDFAGLAGCRALTSFNLAQNSLLGESMVSLGATLAQCSQLAHLNLSGNDLSHAAAQDAVSSLLRSISSLTSLRLRESSVVCSEEVAAAIASLPTLATLDVGCNEYCPTPALTSLFAALGSCPLLSHVELDWLDLGDEGAAELARALPRCTALTHLNLAGNAIGPDGSDHLAGALEHCPGLQSVVLRSNQVAAERLAPALGALSALRRLDLAKNRLGDPGATAIAQVAAVWTRLQTLDLGRTRFGPAGARALAVGLKGCCALETLDLSHNEVGAGGARALREALGPGLRRLTLRNTCIGPAGATRLSEGLGGCRGLTAVDVRCCKIGDDGAASVARALAQAAGPGLTHLDLAVNGVGDRGASRVAESLRGCPALTSLDLHGNRFGRNGRTSLTALHVHCRHLSHLEVEDDGYFGS